MIDAGDRAQPGVDVGQRAVDEAHVDRLLVVLAHVLQEAGVDLAVGELAVGVALAKHEEGGAFMADGYARVRGGLGVCCATTGPGATNALTGVACAYMDSVPLLLLTAQVALHAFGKGAAQESSFHGVDVVVKMHQNGRVVSVAAIFAIGANADGRREVLGLEVGSSEAATFWTDFLRGLVRRGLSGVELVISDAHEGIKAAVSRVLSTSWQHCRVHFLRNAQAHGSKSGRRLIAAFIGAALAQETPEAAHREWRRVSDQIRAKLPKLSQRMDEAERDVLAYKRFPAAHWPKISSTNPIERANAEIKRRTDVVGIFPNEAAIVRLVGAILMELHNEWAARGHRYIAMETAAPIVHTTHASLGASRALAGPGNAGKAR